MLHSAEDCTGMRTNRTIKDVMGASVGSRADTMKQYKKSLKKWKKELKALKKQNKILYNVSNKSGLRREINKINNIRAKSSMKGHHSSRGSFSDYLESDSSLARNISWDKYRRPAGRKEMKRLEHVLANNLKTNKDQSNGAINSELMFDTSNFNLSTGANNPLPVVTVSLQGGKKHRATTVSGLTCLWYSRATNSTIKIKHTKYYERKMRSNRVEYNTAAGVYCTTHDVKVPFCMLEFSGSKKINHRFHIDNDKGESGIGYDMIIVRELMVQLGLAANFKRQVFQWYGATAQMKEPSSFIGQSDITKRKMRKVAMKSVETDSTRAPTEWMVKIIDSTYVKADLKQVANNTTRLNDEERTLLLILIEDLEDLFDGTLDNWATEPFDLELNPYSKPFNSRYYPVPIINKEIFQN